MADRTSKILNWKLARQTKPFTLNKANDKCPVQSGKRIRLTNEIVESPSHAPLGSANFSEVAGLNKRPTKDVVTGCTLVPTSVHPVCHTVLGSTSAYTHVLAVAAVAAQSSMSLGSTQDGTCTKLNERAARIDKWRKKRLSWHGIGLPLLTLEQPSATSHEQTLPQTNGKQKKCRQVLTHIAEQSDILEKVPTCVHWDAVRFVHETNNF